MSVEAFGKHFHLDEDESDNCDEEEKRTRLEALKNKKYNTYPVVDKDSDELTPAQMNSWDKFKELATRFNIFPRSTPTKSM